MTPALLADAASRADLLRLRLTGALEAMRTALAVMAVEPETSLARHRLKVQVDMAVATLLAVNESGIPCGMPSPGLARRDGVWRGNDKERGSDVAARR